ncbi:MAG: hypothetical protein ABID63_16025 [Pseudomonadota bacterium]
MTETPKLIPRLRLKLGDQIALGPGKADLLDGIARTGSIAAAGRDMGVSYKRAWLLIEAMNACFGAPVVETRKGGKTGGGAGLTELGTKILARYRNIETILQDQAAAEIAALQDLIAP